MANTVENTYKKIGNVLEQMFGTASGAKEPTTSSGVGNASNLEMYGMQARQYHLMRNEWNKTQQYTRALVNAEYTIQTEFKIDSGSEPPTEKKSEKNLRKLKEKKEKIEREINKIENNSQ